MARQQLSLRALCWLCAAVSAVLLLGGPVAVQAGKATDGLPREGDVVVLSDENFDWATASGTWLVDIFAPWCSHCQQMEPAWQQLATELKGHNIHVAKIDGTQNRALMKRFAVVGFPSIYLLKDGSTWQYTGMRTVADLKDFALRGYRSTTSLPFHKAPNSVVGRVLGMVYSIPAFARRGYLFLKDDKGFSDTAIISGVLLVPLMFGAVFICVLDAMYTRRGGAFEDGHHHEHHE